MNKLYFDQVVGNINHLQKALLEVGNLDELDERVRDKYTLLILNDLVCSKEAFQIGPAWIVILLKACISEGIIKDKLSHVRAFVREAKYLLQDHDGVDYSLRVEYLLTSGLTMFEEDWYERQYYRARGVDC